MERNERIWQGLGYAGLLPFIIATTMAWTGLKLTWLNAEFALIRGC